MSSDSMSHCVDASFFLAGARCLSAGHHLRLTRLPRHDRGPVPGGNRSAASCLCPILRRALYHYTRRSPESLCRRLNLNTSNLELTINHRKPHWPENSKSGKLSSWEFRMANQPHWHRWPDCSVHGFRRKWIGSRMGHFDCREKTSRIWALIK